jgi:hypothetical protein
MPAAKKAAAKSTRKPAKKAAKKSAKKATRKKAAHKTARKTARKSAAKSGRKYSPGASKSVEREMKAMKQGKLRSGRNGRKVTNPKQAIAIGLSEARKKGAKVPPPPR